MADGQSYVVRRHKGTDELYLFDLDNMPIAQLFMGEQRASKLAQVLTAHALGTVSDGPENELSWLTDHAFHPEWAAYRRREQLNG